MYSDEAEGQKVELTYNHYTVAVTFQNGKMVYKRQGDGNFHDTEIKNFAGRHGGKPVKVVDVHSFAQMVCQAKCLDDLFVTFGPKISAKEDEPLFWSNDDGWVGVESCTYFSAEEQPTLNLPDRGQWVRLTETRYGKQGGTHNA